MRKQGTIARWEAGRGFGFIRAPGSQDVFFHAQDFRGAEGGSPRVGMQVDFEEVHVGGKGPRALKVQPVGFRGPAPPSVANPPTRTSTRRNGGKRTRPRSGAWLALPLMLAYAAVLLYAVGTRKAPWWVLAASAGLNLAAFFAYWQDKDAAEKGQWRIREDTLHLWSLAGGWGGAWIAQQVLRHKSAKPSFLWTYWLTVAVHAGAVGYWAHHWL